MEGVGGGGRWRRLLEAWVLDGGEVAGGDKRGAVWAFGEGGTGRAVAVPRGVDGGSRQAQGGGAGGQCGQVESGGRGGEQGGQVGETGGGAVGSQGAGGEGKGRGREVTER